MTPTALVIKSQRHWNRAHRYSLRAYAAKTVVGSTWFRLLAAIHRRAREIQLRQARAQRPARRVVL